MVLLPVVPAAGVRNRREEGDRSDRNCCWLAGLRVVRGNCACFIGGMGEIFGRFFAVACNRSRKRASSFAEWKQNGCTLPLGCVDGVLGMEH